MSDQDLKKGQKTWKEKTSSNKIIELHAIRRLFLNLLLRSINPPFMTKNQSIENITPTRMTKMNHLILLQKVLLVL